MCGCSPHRTTAREGRLRIALLCESGEPGGAERMILQLAEELRRRGHDVLPLGPANADPWLRGEFRRCGFAPETFPVRGPADPVCLATIVQLLRRHHVDVAHSHAFFAAVYGGAAAWLLRKPHVITMHGSRYYLKHRRRRMALRWSARRSRALVAVSASTAAELAAGIGLAPGAVRVVYNGVPPQAGDRGRVREELGLDAGESFVVAVGSLFPVKGHAVLLRALLQIRHATDLPPWRAAIAGIGGEADALRAFIDEHGLGDRVRLLGFRSDVADVLAAADVYVMPSLFEGAPLALMEAMFASKAIAASAVGGIPELVSHDQEALLTTPGDATALATSLHSLLSDPARRSRLALAAQRRAASQFTLERMTDEYERLYAGA
jgi:glycosyltransferase involved in cell wall biosynthesis